MAKTAQEKADLKAEKLYEKTHKNIYRTSVGDQIFNVINYVVYTLFTIICIFPFYYLFINTISDNDLVVKGLINFIPRGIHFGNYAALLNVSDLMSSFSAYGCRISLHRLSRNTAGDVGTKSLVPFYRNHDVFQCRINSVVFEYADAWSDKYLLGIYHPRYCGTIQYYSCKNLHRIYSEGA